MNQQAVQTVIDAVFGGALDRTDIREFLGGVPSGAVTITLAAGGHVDLYGSPLVKEPVAPP